MPKIIAESKKVIFNGDNYTEAWHKEAEKRGLPNRKSTIDSLPDLISEKSIKLFGKYGVFSEREIHSRYEILLENYIKTINIESQLTTQIASRQILPAALRYQAIVADSVAKLKAAGAKVPSSQVTLLDDLSATIEQLQVATAALVDAIEEHADRRHPGPRQVHARHDHPRDGRRPCRRRQARNHGRRRPLAAADLPGDAVHQVTRTRQVRLRPVHRACPRRPGPRLADPKRFSSTPPPRRGLPGRRRFTFPGNRPGKARFKDGRGWSGAIACSRQCHDAVTSDEGLAVLLPTIALIPLRPAVRSDGDDGPRRPRPDHARRGPATSPRPAINLGLVLDNSASMKGKKIDYARRPRSSP